MKVTIHLTAGNEHFLLLYWPSLIAGNMIDYTQIARIPAIAGKLASLNMVSIQYRAFIPQIYHEIPVKELSWDLFNYEIFRLLKPWDICYDIPWIYILRLIDTSSPWYRVLNENFTSPYILGTRPHMQIVSLTAVQSQMEVPVKSMNIKPIMTRVTYIYLVQSQSSVHTG